MNKKSFFIICSTLIIASNLLMISVVNKGEETGSNLFVIAIACVLLPAFLYAVENQLRINTPDSVDSYIPTPSYQQNREYA